MRIDIGKLNLHNTCTALQFRLEDGFGYPRLCPVRLCRRAVYHLFGFRYQFTIRGDRLLWIP